MLFSLKNLWLPVSLLLMINCSTPSKQNNNLPSKKNEVNENPRPVMEPQTDSLKKVLDEKRVKKIKN